MGSVAVIALAARLGVAVHTTMMTLSAAILAIISLGASPFPLVVALSAGILTTLNPCGFVLLPAYVAYVLHGPRDRHAVTASSTGWHVLRSGLLGVPLTAGFLLIFLVAGGVLTLGGHLVVGLFPWLALLVGAGLIGLGGWTLITRRRVEFSSLRKLTTWLARRRRRGIPTSQLTRGGGANLAATEAAPTMRFPSQLVAAWGFGLGYGVSSLGCALPVFLLVVANASTTTDLRTVLAILAAYSLGIALVMFAVALGAAAVHDLLRRAIFPLLRWVQPLSALLMLAAGIYIMIYQLRAGLLLP
jgi:cytochrome c biogenesis protein CcdA